MRLPVQMTLVPIIVGSAHGPVELSSFALLAVLDICEVHDEYKYMYRKWHIEFPPVESVGAGNEPILSQKFIQHLGHPWVTSD